MTLTIAELDAEIEEAEHKIMSLKSRRNGLTMLCRVPPEIIVRIIKCIQGRVDSSFPVRVDMTQPLDTQWRHFMLGCKYLRDVAMENPDVWACVDGAWRKEWIQLCAGRAKESPMVVSADSRVKGRSNRTSVLRYLSQASAARLWPGSWREHERMAEALHNRPLKCMTTLDYGRAEAGDVEVKLETFLGGSVAQLESLVMESTAIIGRAAHEFSNLRQIECSALYVGFPHHTEGLLVLLRHTPRLEVLLLKFIGSARLQAEHVHTIDMPNLRSVHLQGTRTTVWNILRHLPNPEHTLHVSLMNIPGDATSYWRPHLGGVEAEILATIMQFCEAKAGRKINPPGYVMLSSRPDGARDGAVSREVLAIAGVAPKFSFMFMAPCEITEHTPILDLVQNARLIGFRHGEMLRTPSMQAFRKIRCIDIEGATTNSIGGVEDWVRRRQQESPNDPLSLNFINCRDDGAREGALRIRDMLSADRVKIDVDLSVALDTL
jgi:hypothetical protein